MDMNRRKFLTAFTGAVVGAGVLRHAAVPVGAAAVHVNDLVFSGKDIAIHTAGGYHQCFSCLTYEDIARVLKALPPPPPRRLPFQDLLIEKGIISPRLN